MSIARPHRSKEWDGATLLVATPSSSPTSCNLQATGKVGLGIGPTRDLVLIEGTAPALTAIDFPDQVGDAFAAKTGFDPRQLSDYLYFRIQPSGSKHGGKPANSRTATSCGPDTGSSLAEQETVVSARSSLPYRRRLTEHPERECGGVRHAALRQPRAVSEGTAMTDYGREVRFGYFLIPNAADPLLATAQEVERLGLDYIGVQDHPYQRRYVDTWTLLAMIAATTARVRVFPDVANLPLRPPAVLAKAAASLDRLSGGRFELGLGAGGFWDAIAAYGGPRRSLAEAFRALAEAIEVIRMVWSGERNLRFQGEFYRLAGAHSGPVPDRRIGIWLGVYGPKALRLAGRMADGWVPSFRGQLQSLREMTGRLEEGAAEAGRDPGEVRRILNVGGVISDGTSEGVLRGPVDQWTEELTSLVVEDGFDTFVLWAEEPGQLARFAEEVVPAVRQQVARERARKG